MLVEDVAMEVYEICRERLNSTKKCIELINKNIIKVENLSDPILEEKVRKYRQSYKGLEDLSKYVHDKIIQSKWKSLIP